MMDSSSTLIAFLLGMSIGACIMLLAATAFGRGPFKGTEWPKWITIGRSRGAAAVYIPDAPVIAKELPNRIVVAIVEESKFEGPWDDYYVIATDQIGIDAVRSIINGNIPE